MTFNSTITTEAAVGFLASAIAIYLYSLRKRVEKKNAAIVVLSEIRQAESAIPNLVKEKVFGDSVSVLPANHWQQTKHLFVSSLDQDELDAIDSFYQSCELIEEKVSFIKQARNITLEEKFRIIQQMVADAYKTDPRSPSFIAAEAYLVDKRGATPDTPAATAIEYAKSVAPLLNTPAGAKLKKIASVSSWLPSLS